MCIQEKKSSLCGIFYSEGLKDDQWKLNQKTAVKLQENKEVQESCHHLVSTI